MTNYDFIMEKYANWNPEFQEKLQETYKQWESENLYIIDGKAIKKFLIENIQDSYKDYYERIADAFDMEIDIDFFNNDLEYIAKIKIKRDQAIEFINGDGMYYPEIIDSDFEEAERYILGIIDNLEEIYQIGLPKIDFDDLFYNAVEAGCYPYGTIIQCGVVNIAETIKEVCSDKKVQDKIGISKKELLDDFYSKYEADEQVKIYKKLC